MKSRLPLFLLLSVFAVGCSGDSGDSGAMAESEAAAEPAMDDAAAVSAISDNFVTHFNLHHASMVADLYTEDGVRLNANRAIDMSRDEIAATLETSMASAPTLSVTPAEQKIIGDWAVSRGSYGVELTPEGQEAMAYGGYYMSVARKVEGEWKIRLTITNYDSPRPEGWSFADLPEDDTEEITDGPFADLIAGYMTHYNLGHPEMVADFYADDAVVAFADAPLAEGREAIVARLQDNIGMGSPQLTVHNAATWDLGDGWYVDGGWYDVVATTPDGEVGRGGTYVTLATKAEDGTSKIQWMVTNGWPAPE